MSVTVAMTLAIGSRVGPYEILAPLGAGGMGEVYKARDTRLRRDVALKVLPAAFASDRDRLARFTREAQVLASLNHPHIAQIYGLEEAPASAHGHLPVHALAMELVPGDTLDVLLASQPHGAVSIDTAIGIARQIAEALAAAHEKGIVHRDLKPGNLMIAADGTVKVLDFGLAKAVEHDSSSADAIARGESPTTMPRQATSAGVVLGTAAYMSPEQARGLIVDKRTDVWAFGCVLYEMLTGRRAFSGDTVTDILAAIMRDLPDWTRLPSATPFLVIWLLERCLDKDPRQRLQDLGDVRLLLADGSRLTSGAVPATALRPRISPWLAGLGWMGAALCAIALVSLGTIALWHWREISPIERIAQFTIDPPEGTQFPRPTQLAISPDGRLVVFSLGAGATSALWLRPVASLVARPLTGTEGAILPFWSPDSQAIGFFASGKLLTVRVEGETPSLVCNVSTGRGATWNRDNVIVFSGAADAPLQRVAATGGTPMPVTTLAPPRENSHRMPSFLPDGRHFVYLAGGTSATGGIAWQVKVGTIDGPATTTVIEAVDINAAPVFSAGHIMFGRNRSLVAIKFEPTTLKTSGAPVAVLDQPVWTTSSSSAGFAVSPDGLLAFVPTSGAVPSRLTWFDKGGKPLAPVGEMGIQNGVALSPDEQRVAIVLETGNPRRRDIWMVDVATGAASKFTVDPTADENAPLWSPDGSILYYASTRNGASNVYRKAVDGHGPELPLQSSDRSQYPSDLTKDNKMVFIQVTTSGTDIWALSLSGEEKPWPIVQGPSAKTGASVSPDGHWLAYQSNETGRNEIYVTPFPRGGQPRQLSTEGGSEPTWSADGKHLYFLTGGGLQSAPVTVSDHLSLGPPDQLIPLPTLAANQTAVQRTYAVTRDGRRVLRPVPDKTPNRTPITVITNWRALVK